MAEQQAGRRRRWSTWVGGVCILVGLSLLLYVAWQYWGTNWVSHRKHEQVVGEVRTIWERGEDAAETEEGTASALVRIPAFGDDYVVPLLEGVRDEALAAGFGHFEDNAMPGEVGNFAIAGHRVTHGEPLREMPALEVGDEIIVETRTTTYYYELTSGGDDLRVSFDDGWVVDDPLPTNPERGGVQPAQVEGQRLITLTTCAELFHTDDRLVAFGVLDHKEEK